MKKRTLFKKIFSRDFTLVIIEIWWRGEVIDPKIWTDKKQPYLPYIVFENTGLAINGYYDPRGIRWCKQILINGINNSKSFSFIEVPFRKMYNKLKPICDKQPILSQNNLLKFFKNLEDIWPWFEALWWVWEFGLYNKYKFISSEQSNRLIKLREESQYLVPGAEAVIRKSLKKIYPSLKDLISVVTIEEIASSNLPLRKILKQRASGYFFTDNHLYTARSRSFIENKFNINLEKLTEEKVKKFKGQSAFKGLVKGTVKIVYGTRQMDKVEHGDIIVTPMTMPYFLPAIKKAGAIVTDEGGLTCHAAIVARELNKPCLVGTKIATKVLKDGDLVEVDANKGIVKILK